MDYAATCEGCRAMYAGRTPPGEAPCRTCRIDPMEDNREALGIFFMVQYQLVMGFNGPVDLNHLAVEAAIEREGIRDRKGCFNKVVRLGYWWINRDRNKDGK